VTLNNNCKGQAWFLFSSSSSSSSSRNSRSNSSSMQVSHVVQRKIKISIPTCMLY